MKTKHNIYMIIKEQCVNTKKILTKINEAWKDNHDFLEETCKEEINEIRNFLKTNETYIKKIEKLENLLFEKDWVEEHSMRTCYEYDCNECKNEVESVK